jgi:hypothetical protein
MLELAGNRFRWREECVHVQARALLPRPKGGRDSEEGEDGAVRQLDIQDAWGRIRAGWTESGNLIEF